MHRLHKSYVLILTRLVLTVLCCSILAGKPDAQSRAAEQAEILRVTVGTPTFLSPLVYQNRASVTVSRAGVVAAFYPKPGTGPKFYRTSTDEGRT